MIGLTKLLNKIFVFLLLTTVSSVTYATKCKTQILIKNELEIDTITVTKIAINGDLSNGKKDIKNITIRPTKIRSTGSALIKLRQISQDSEGQFKVLYKKKVNSVTYRCSSRWQTQVCDDQVELFVIEDDNLVYCIR